MENNFTYKSNSDFYGLSPSDISGCVGWFSFNIPYSGTNTFQDSVSLAIGSAVNPMTIVQGRIGSGINSGSPGYFRCGSSPPVGNWKIPTKTINAWVYPYISHPGTSVITSLSAGNWYVGIAALNRPIISYTNANSSQQTSTQAFNVGSYGWHMYTYQYIGSGNFDITTQVILKYYVDGIFAGSRTFNSGMSLNFGNAITAGALSAVGANAVSGLIDEISIYDRELTSDEISRLYWNGYNKFKTFNASSGLVLSNSNNQLTLQEV